ncbi:hypothetical protein J437_LFUL010995 [Ladona fulva]|uniref:Uncharacterized protein n=1 Tax=Ladona fulva TaxID=123851 RepID=A0A8K0P7Q5_LADFU|nr:hypothetical protein J437_LFUL010995 [Ladona fulva]
MDHPPCIVPPRYGERSVFVVTSGRHVVSHALTAMNWKDKREVLLLSMYHSDEMVSVKKKRKIFQMVQKSCNRSNARNSIGECLPYFL